MDDTLQRELVQRLQQLEREDFDSQELGPVPLVLRALEAVQQVEIEEINGQCILQGNTPVPDAQKVYLEDRGGHGDFICNTLIDTDSDSLDLILGELLKLWMRLAADVQNGLVDVEDCLRPEIYEGLLRGTLSFEDFVLKGVYPTALQRQKELQAIDRRLAGVDASAIDMRDEKSFIVRDLNGEFDDRSTSRENQLYHYRQSAYALITALERYMAETPRHQKELGLQGFAEVRERDRQAAAQKQRAANTIKAILGL